jgi:hypothetical protein
VDVLGIKLGQSTVAQTRAALAAVTPTLEINESRASLLGYSAAERASPQQVSIPNSDYVSTLRATTVNCQIRTNLSSCESISVTFSTPPGEGIAVSANRKIDFRQGPPLDSTVRSLTDKYGQHGFHSSHDGMNHVYVWVWSESGKPVQLSIKHPCASVISPSLGPLNTWERNAKSALQAGCAVSLRVFLLTNAGTVTHMNLETTDHLSVLAAVHKTGALIAKGVAHFEQAEKAKAAKTAPPRL